MSGGHDLGGSDLDPRRAPSSTDLAFPEARAREVVRGALDEDLGGPDGVDVTSSATIPTGQRSTAHVVARQGGVLAGAPVLELVFGDVARRLRAERLDVELRRRDGDRLAEGEVLAILRGSTQVTLVGERTALNLLSRLSGVATHMRRWADALAGTGATVLDTRKTTPLLRDLEKYAVRCGGGTNKRMGLYDVAMVKDNHKVAAGSVAAAFAAIRRAHPEVEIQVEVETREEALEAVAAGARFLLCDNMPVPLLRSTVDAVRGAGEHVEIEATGGLTLEVARDYALTGVDYLSVGALTHSSPILDVALDLADVSR